LHTIWRTELKINLYIYTPQFSWFKSGKLILIIIKKKTQTVRCLVALSSMFSNWLARCVIRSHFYYFFYYNVYYNNDRDTSRTKAPRIFEMNLLLYKYIYTILIISPNTDIAVRLQRFKHSSESTAVMRVHLAGETRGWEQSVEFILFFLWYIIGSPPRLLSD